MRLDAMQRVSYDMAKARVLLFLFSKPALYMAKASECACEIWPNHSMKAQGAGAAASRILKRMEKSGLVQWHSSGDWGYVLTPTGRIQAEREKSREESYCGGLQKDGAKSR